MWCLAVAFLLAAAAPVAVAGATSPRPQAWTAADTSLGTINVPPDGSRVYSAPLTAGVTYRLVLTGMVVATAKDNPGYTITYDANGGGLVNQPILRTYYEGAEPAVNPFFWSLNPSTLHQPSPDPSHRYEVTFTAARSSRLEARVDFGVNANLFTFQGGYTLELLGPALGPGPGPSGGGSPGADKPATVLSAAKWGKPGPPTALGPGDAAIAPGPQIASGQTDASVTVSGDAAGKTGIVLGVPEPGKKLTGGDCVRAAVNLIKESGNHSSGEALAVNVTTIYYFYLAACLEYVRELDQQAAPRSAVVVARSSCDVRAVSLSVQVDRAAGTIRYRSRRASRHGTSRRLRVSCRKARNGKVTMRIKTRSRRTKLRKVLGKRLVVGLYRPRAATGTANVRTTFKRR